MSKVIVPIHLGNLSAIPTSVQPGFKLLYLRMDWLKLYNGFTEIDLVLGRPLDNYSPKPGIITSKDTVLSALEKLQYQIITGTGIIDQNNILKPEYNIRFDLPEDDVTSYTTLITLWLATQTITVTEKEIPHFIFTVVYGNDLGNIDNLRIVYLWGEGKGTHIAPSITSLRLMSVTLLSKPSPVNVPDATTTVKGIVKLVGDLSGSADLPTVPALLNKENIFNKISTISGSSTGQYPNEKAVVDYVTLIVTGIQTDITTIEGDIAAIETDITLIKADIVDLETDITTIEGDITTIQGDITTIQTDITAIEGDITAIEGNITTIQGDITAIQGDITTIEGEIAVIESDISALDSEITIVQTDLLDKTEWKRNWTPIQYLKNEQVIDEGYLAIANKTTVERPAPQKIGEPFNVYQGTIGTTTASARQVLFGSKYAFTKNVFFEGWRVNLVAGNKYVIYLVRDPDGDNVIAQILQFTAQTTGWANLTAQGLIIEVGNTYAAIAIVSEPTPVVTPHIHNWNYTQPQNNTIPVSGGITHAKATPSILYVSNFDSTAVDRSAELALMNIGDLIKVGNSIWAVQSKNAQSGYFIFGISPALLHTPLGVQAFNFETRNTTTLTYPLDPDPIYWTNHPSPVATILGLLGIDQSYFAITPTPAAYGIDILVQDLILSPDWDIQAYSGVGSSGGSSGSSGGGVPLTTTLDINGVAYDLSTSRAWRTAQADTGVLYFEPPGLIANTTNPTTSINIPFTYGYVIDNETMSDIPVYTLIEYPGANNVLVISRTGTNPASYVLLQPSGVLNGANVIFQNNFPTSTQRKSMIFLGKIGHPNGGPITTVINSPDYITSPQAFVRDLFQALGPFINENVYPSNSNANLTFTISAGNFYGAGINFANDKTNPNKLVSTLKNPALFLYRTSSGTGSVTPVSNVDRLNYSNAGVVTPVPAGPNNSQVQYLWAIPGSGFVMEYGQQTYGSLDDARNAVGKEIRTTFANLPGNAILLAALVVRNGATNLSLLTDAQWYKADKLGQLSPVGGSISGSGSSGYTVLPIVTTDAILTQTSGEIVVRVNATSSNIFITVPTAVGNTAKFHIKKIAGTFNVILDPVNVQTIDGGLTAVILQQYASVTIISDNSNWIVI